MWLLEVHFFQLHFFTLLLAGWDKQLEQQQDGGQQERGTTNATLRVGELLGQLVWVLCAYMPPPHPCPAQHAAGVGPTELNLDGTTARMPRNTPTRRHYGLCSNDYDRKQ